MTKRVKIEKSKLFFVIPKTISVIPYPYNFLVSYPLSLTLFCQLSLIPKTPNRASLARAHERAHVHNVRDFPQTKLDGEINPHFLLNEHGDPRIFFQVFAKDSVIKNIFEEEKKYDSGKRFIFGK